MDELTKALDEKTLVLGKDRTLKKLKKGEVSKVFLANNCSDKIKEEILKNKNKTEIIELDISNEELNIRCKKPFNISVLSY
jgi:ribosomal protein L30E|tara:strand:+ start:765 stop:1007 length:243 start_codon:yes stop_codon:yes gene_type:complete